MASASSTSARNLFSDSRRRLCERAVASVHSVGSVSRQVARGSRSHDILTASAKQLCQTEATAMENSFNNLQRMQVLLAQIAHAQSSIEDNLKKVEGVGEQIRDMQRIEWKQQVATGTSRSANNKGFQTANLPMSKFLQLRPLFVTAVAKHLNRTCLMSTAGTVASAKVPMASSVSHFHTTSAAAMRPPTDQQQADNKPDKVAQLKQAVKDYGSTVIVFHVGISLVSLGFFYAIVSTGIDVVGLVSRLPYLGAHLAESAAAAGATTFVMAYAVHKVFAPVRIGITLSSAPLIVRYLRQKGILKQAKKP